MGHSYSAWSSSRGIRVHSGPDRLDPRRSELERDAPAIGQRDSATPGTPSLAAVPITARETNDDLRGRLVGVLHYAADQIGRLEVHARYWKDEDDLFVRRRDKAAAEALLLAFLASRVGGADPERDRAVGKVCDIVDAQIATPRNEALLRRFPQTAATLGLAYVILEKLGRRHPSVLKLLRRAALRGFLTLSERGPFRMMDVRWTYSQLWPDLVGPLEEVVRYSTLASSPHPIYTRSDDEYALTHAVMYLTDFGRRSVPEGMESLVTSHHLDPFLSWNCVAPDLDLLGEFLVAAMALRQPTSPTFRFAWDLYFQTWDDESGLTGPDYSAKDHATLAGDEGEAYVFWHNYHTIFVGGIVCAVALVTRSIGLDPSPLPLPEDYSELLSRCAEAAVAAGSVRASSEQRTASGAGDLEWLIGRLLALQQKDMQDPPCWLKLALESSIPRWELISVLLDAMLTTAARHYYLLQLAEGLVFGARHYEIGLSLTFFRALEFLLDQQLPDGRVGVHHVLDPTKQAIKLEEAQATMALLLSELAGQTRLAIQGLHGSRPLRSQGRGHASS